MKFLAISFLLNIKKFLLCRTFWCTLVALPVILALGGMFFQAGGSVVTITAGVHFNPANPLEAAIFDALEETPFTRFVAYDDIERLLEDVRLGRIECGYVFNANIENAKKGNFEGIITLVTSARTMTAPIFNDLVAAAVLRASAEYITKGGLNDLFGQSDEISYFTAVQFAAYNEMDIFMTPIFETIAGQTEKSRTSLAEITTRRVFRGIIGLSIHVLILFAAPIFIDEKRQGIHKALAVHGKLVTYNLSLFAAAFIIIFAIGAAGLASVFIFAPSLPLAISIELAALAAISAVLAGLLVLAGFLLKTAKFIQTMGLFIIIANIFFGGVILDLTEISPQLTHIQWIFPLFWYTSLS